MDETLVRTTLEKANSPNYSRKNNKNIKWWKKQRTFDDVSDDFSLDSDF